MASDFLQFSLMTSFQADSEHSNVVACVSGEHAFVSVNVKTKEVLIILIDRWSHTIHIAAATKCAYQIINVVTTNNKQHITRSAANAIYFQFRFTLSVLLRFYISFWKTNTAQRAQQHSKSWKIVDNFIPFLFVCVVHSIFLDEPMRLFKQFDRSSHFTTMFLPHSLSVRE